MHCLVMSVKGRFYRESWRLNCVISNPPDLAIAECDGEAAEVPVDDLDGVVGGAGDVEGGGAARDHLLHLPVTPGVVHHHV